MNRKNGFLKRAKLRKNRVRGSMSAIDCQYIQYSLSGSGVPLSLLAGSCVVPTSRRDPFLLVNTQATWTALAGPYLLLGAVQTATAEAIDPETYIQRFGYDSKSPGDDGNTVF